MKFTIAVVFLLTACVAAVSDPTPLPRIEVHKLYIPERPIAMGVSYPDDASVLE